jgi:hypothetical protein
MRQKLSSTQCAALREELQRARERLAYLYAMERYPEVVTEADRYRATIHFCDEFAERDEDRVDVDTIATVVILQTRAATALSVGREDWVHALYQVDEGLRTLLAIFADRLPIRAYDRAKQVRALERLRRDLLDQLFPGPRAQMRTALHDAVREERYEDAARLRDRLRRRR